MNILIFIIILLILVLVHEFGHFFTAKRFGIRVDEFGFGFPPKIFGENPDEESESGPDSGRSFLNKPKWQQAIVLLAGVFANFLLAWVFFSIGFISGLPTSTGSGYTSQELSDVHLVVVSVLSKSPAEIAGLKSGDKIVSLESGKDKVPNVNPDTLKSFVLAHSGKEINIGYLRGNTKNANLVKVIPIPDKESGRPAIGIAMDEIGVLKLLVLRAFWEGMKLDWHITKGTAMGLYGLIADAIRGRGSFSSITGPVGIVGIVGDAYKLGFSYLLSFAALISVNLSIINILPFPALDGGRLLFLLIEKIKGSSINPKVANTANMIGFGILIFLMLLVTYHDVVKLL